MVGGGSGADTPLSRKTISQILSESGLIGSEQLKRMALKGVKPRLGELLVERGMVTPEELEAALELQSVLGSAAGSGQQPVESASTSGRPKLGQLLVEQGIISSRELAIMLGLQMGIPYVNPSTYQIQPEALSLISETIARKHSVIPLAVADKALYVAMADTEDTSVREALEAQTGMRIEPAIAPADEIKEAIDRIYGGSEGKPGITVAPSVAAEAVAGETIAEALEATVHEDGGTEPEMPAQDDNSTIVQEPVAASDSTLDMTSLNLNKFQVELEALKLIPESIARRYNAIPLAITRDALRVAVVDTDDVLTLEALAAWARMRIEPIMATAKEIQGAIDRNYKGYGEIEKQFSITPGTLLPKEGGAPGESLAGAPVVRALDLIVDEAIKNRASDIHIEAEADGVRLRYRIDGVLHEIASLPLNAHAPLISRLKILANMNIADHHRPQDGQFSVKVRGKEVDVRVATIPTAYGEMGVLRILDKSFAALSLGELGFSPANLEQYRNMLKSAFGMILISGPTGSGKTTTLYASVNSLDYKGRNIITIEDPVEYHFKDINQIQINPRAGLTFATGLRSIMRHDPDVILVGEIRDPETADIAIQAALTGHLVLASVHANDAVGALFRLLDLGVPSFLVSSALIACVAQRMVRRICPHCGCPSRAPVEAQVAYCKEMGEEKAEFLYGGGCNSCTGTGYLGRVAVFEIMRMSDEVRRLLLNGANAGQIRDQARGEGMVTMWRDGMLKVKSGITTPSEVLRNVFTIG